MYKDKIAGTLIGLAVGDALGVPHEFKAQKNNIYTGILYLVPEFNFKFNSRKDVIGQYSDDVEQTLCNLRSIIELNGYNKEAVILKYLKWAEKSKAMGRNTRNLFKGVKTISGYQKRYNKIFDINIYDSWTQSNGSLMRCSMLAYLPNYVDACMIDCKITNPHTINIQSSLLYCVILRYTAIGVNKQHIINCMLQDKYVFTLSNEVKFVINQAVNNKEFSRNIKEIGKGWVLHTLYCAVWAWYHHETYQDPIDVIIRQGGDTDTNAAVAGALLGAYLGYDKLCQEERTKRNIQIVRNADFSLGENPRPQSCCLHDFDQLVENYSKLVGNDMK